MQILRKIIPYVLLSISLIVGLSYWQHSYADNVDVSQTSGSTGIGFGDTGNGRDYMCQGFKMGTYNQITAVSFYPNGVGPGNDGYAVWIDNADSNSNPLGTVAVGIGGFTEIPHASVITGSLNKYTLSSPVTVTIGSQYDVCFAPWNTVTHVWANAYNDWVSSTANPYASGRRVHLNASFASPSAPDAGADDIQFKIWGQTLVIPTYNTFNAVASKDKVVAGSVNIGAIPNPAWQIKSIDVMKYTKDNICGQASTSTIDTQIADVVNSGANYISISGYYDNPGCGSDQIYMAKWVGEIRSKSNLHIWWRMKDLSWEGDYSVQKASSTIISGIHQTAMDNWLNTNSSNTPITMQAGDIFTPFAEVQNGGINGVESCGSSICQFNDKGEFNTFINLIYNDAKARVPAGVIVGCWGFDGFITAGLDNTFWQGQSFLSTTTMLSSGPMSIDDYPSSYGTGAAGTAENFTAHLALFHSVIQTVSGSSTIPLIVGEYGTINATSTSDQAYQVNLELPQAQADALTIGFNYWNLGPVNDVTGEGLITNALGFKPGYNLLKRYYSQR